MSITSHSLLGKIYPNKKFVVYFNRGEKKKRAEKQYDRLIDKQYDSYLEVEKDYKMSEPKERQFVSKSYHELTAEVSDLYSSGAIAEHVLDGIHEVLRPIKDIKVDCLDRLIESCPLFIKAKESSRDLIPDSRRKKESYGSKGITRYGRRVVDNTAVLLQRKYGKERLGFVTCTLPSLPEDLHHKLNGVWGEVVRRFYQKLKRQLAKISKPFIYVGVTEIQEKRYKRTGVPAPHLHFVYLCRDSKFSRYWLYVCQIHRAWNKAVREGIALCGYPDEMSQLLDWGSVHCKRVQKSAGGYLGKYMSKGGKVLESMKKAGWTEFPKQWWTACMQCKKLFKESIVTLDSHVCKMLFYNLGDCIHEGMIAYAAYVDILMRGEYKCVALAGTLSFKGYGLLGEP